jgi:hypothetical protein
VQERVVRKIRMLRAMWRGLETESRGALTRHERGNPGYRQEQSLRVTAPVLDPTFCTHQDRYTEHDHHQARCDELGPRRETRHPVGEWIAEYGGGDCYNRGYVEGG